jgi:hypothetical protein
MKFILLCLFLSSWSLASSNDLDHRPKSFKVSRGKAVFVDFTHATYHITYDISKRRTMVLADMKMNVVEAGRPVFDSVMKPYSVMLNGERVSVREVSTPSRETKVRVLNQDVPEGSHRLTIEIPLTNLVSFGGGGVKSAFWNSDINNRGFLERYLPANLEYDQVKMDFVVKFIGASTKQAIYTNGEVTEHPQNIFTISYPSHYTSSSIFFHTVPVNSVEEIRFNMKSIDGRDLPTVIYASSGSSEASNLEGAKRHAQSIVKELEGDYGPFPHPSITIYNAGTGGMEYCGATMSSLGALGHELFHSYFSRGVMPANGNAGWIDEALASWRDGGYQKSYSLQGTSRLSIWPYYNRFTDVNAYRFGERFMSYMDAKLESKGGLKPFMRHMVENKLFTPFFIEEFIAEMSEYYKESVKEDFYKYTFGNQNISNVSYVLKHQLPQGIEKAPQNEHPHHQKMSFEELENHL